MFNEIDGDLDEVAVKTFKVSLPSKHSLRKSLTGKPVTSLRQLMDRVDKYKRIEDDQNKEKGKLRLSLRKGEISGWTDTTITDRKGIMRVNQGLIVLRSSVRCSESQCIKY